MKSCKLAIAALIVFLTPACGSNNKESTPVKLTSNPSELVFEAAGGTQELTITSGIKPDVSCSDSWISLTEGSFSANTFKLGVTAQAHTGTDERRSTIRVIGDKQSLMISVKQKVPAVKLSVDKDKVSFDRFGGEATVTVTSSTQPSVSAVASWCGAETGSIPGRMKRP